MGYESKVIAIQRVEYETPTGNTLVFGDEIAHFDLCKMGDEMVDGKRFNEVFTKPIDFDLYNMAEHSADDEWDRRTDCYGAICKMATIEEVMAWVEKSETIKEYRRAQLFYSFLLALVAHQHKFGTIMLVHFGY